jgi:AAA domain/Ankyrin repeats (3 copies)/UvrD-like helicase C-terminal domain
MKILEYGDLDIAGVEDQYKRVIGHLADGNFTAVDVKKLTPTNYLRAKIDYATRLLFQIRRHGNERYALALEVIRNHEYEKSRFLRGVKVDEDKIPPITEEAAERDAPVIPYVNPTTPRFHLLDKPISFDEAQEEIYRLPSPLIIIGAAGSGKTALTLEKLKRQRGDILYVTLSSFLAKNARDLYFAHHYENEHQNIDFLSYREFLETIEVPKGEEINFARFRAWFARHQAMYRFTDAHKLFEEFKGVITGASLAEAPYLSKEEYFRLGVRQSIFLEEERARAYEVFEKYLSFLKEGGLFDANIASHERLAKSTPRYDFVVVDEVQDLTNIQIALIMRSLKRAGEFLLCGDSNQIVHPNFFSWSKVKSLFYGDAALRGEVSGEEGVSSLIHILHTNFRNSPEVTGLSNRLLKIKQRQFGSIDRESNFLVKSISTSGGAVELHADTDAVKRDLDEKTRGSAKFALLVMREEDKALARKWFRTPLLFSVHEAKGLEYENVILFNFISGNRNAFSTVAEGIALADLEADLVYSRGKDKADKTAEVYKFFTNSLYVAITRAVKNLYWIEADTKHVILSLLGVKEAARGVGVEAQKSSLEDWQREARKLELQGKMDQAEEIRRSILRTEPVPWTVHTRERFFETIEKALDAKSVSNKPKEHLYEYAAYFEEPRLFSLLAENKFEKAKQGRSAAISVQASVQRKYLSQFESKNLKEVLSLADRHGPDFRNQWNHTPLMCAARVGNIPLVDALLARGANPELFDNYGRSALHMALISAMGNPDFARLHLGPLYERLAPDHMSIMASGRLIKMDAHTIEYFLFQLLVAAFHRFLNSAGHYYFHGITTVLLEDMGGAFPEDVFPSWRKRRTYLSSVLSRNEVDREYPYNRFLFRRLRTGHYTFNHGLKVRSGDQWFDLHEFLGLSLMARYPWMRVRQYLEDVGLEWLMEPDARGGPGTG